MNSRARASAIDASGVSLSFLCLAHCLLLPTAAAAAPALAPGLAEHLGAEGPAHLILFLIAAPVSILGLVWGARLARAGWRTITAAGAGLFLMFLGAAHLLAQPGETVLTVAGVLMVAGAHAANWRARARAGHAHKTECGVCAD